MVKLKQNLKINSTHLIVLVVVTYMQFDYYAVIYLRNSVFSVTLNVTMNQYSVDSYKLAVKTTAVIVN